VECGGRASGDTAFDYTEAPGHSEAAEIAPHQSGVAPLFPLAAALHIKPRRQVEENEMRPVIAAPFFLLAPAAFWRILSGRSPALKRLHGRHNGAGPTANDCE